MESFINRYANFSDRANRREYGYYILLNLTFMLVVFLMSVLIDNKLASFFNLCFFLLVMLVPTVAVTIRRLKDLGMKWNFFLLIFIPFFNLVLTLYLLITPGKRF
jgi:uncharacterized membrane protein YhaH (DUF805 family)